MNWRSMTWDSVTYWALDLETGGLDPASDPILAVGMVPIRSGRIHLGESYQSLVRPADLASIRPISVHAHQLLPCDLREAPEAPAVLAEIDRRIREGALLVHQAAFDIEFLRQAYRRERMRWPGPPVVDTVHLILKAAKRARFIDPGAQDGEPELNLLAARRRVGLPEYCQHDALTDAIAAAELFLVLRGKIGARRLGDLR